MNNNTACGSKPLSPVRGSGDLSAEQQQQVVSLCPPVVAPPQAGRGKCWLARQSVMATVDQLIGASERNDLISSMVKVYVSNIICTLVQNTCMQYAHIVAESSHHGADDFFYDFSSA